MNDMFYTLPEEKQMRIINAGLEVFSKNDYKHAVTDDIARKAGISKGLLFYYFQNKKSLYLFLLDYCSKLIMNQIMNEHFHEITDFFELIEYGAKEKTKVMEKNPYLMDFTVRCLYTSHEAVSDDVNRMFTDKKSGIFTEYFKNVDYSKFRDGICPEEIYNMLKWMTEGYVQEQRWAGIAFQLDDLLEKFYVWEKLMKKIAYKDEYQEE